MEEVELLEEEMTLTVLIKKAGLTGREFAELMGVSTNTVSDWNLRKATPKLDAFAQACAILDVPAPILLLVFGIPKHIVEQIPGEYKEETVVKTATVYKFRSKKKKRIQMVDIPE